MHAVETYNSAKITRYVYSIIQPFVWRGNQVTCAGGKTAPMKNLYRASTYDLSVGEIIQDGVASGSSPID
jgi:phosphoribosylaminoimidazole (AIR) synthetase